MKLNSQQRQAFQKQLEAHGWRCVITSECYRMLPPEEVATYRDEWIMPLGHPGRLPDFPISLPTPPIKP